MGKVSIGLNAEYSRSSDKPFEWAVEHAAKMGYKFFEPMVHFGRELMSEAGYFHTVSLFDDPYRIKNACDEAGLTISGLQSHGPLGRPEVHGEYIKLAIRTAAEIGAPVVNTDEGIKAKWTTEEEDFVLIKYTLQEAAFVAERRNIKIGLEQHAQYSQHPEGLERIYNLVDSDAIGINFDTGNAYLCGHDVYGWLDSVVERLVHLHAKDISVEHSDSERGKVTGTPVGCACGEGILDWERIIKTVRDNCPNDIVFSVECGTPVQAARSLEYLGQFV
ncbi:sugar phosphate isomerase/epimerase family protein [Bremerella alba]|uniref:Inosose dehydratase n=1 Tax=Bremerella alba TaxID=980252 RepID=A0A7V8V388_9BACT|nr:sugar phosphate isomerase/epimerase [Bremerella alba]MBA2114117.1 Inosose dehydratase [Bremerella alba]